jgi:RNA polymerase sigma-70 factor (ECF subfamily)
MKYIITESQYKILKETVEFEDVYKETFPNIYRTVCMRYAKGDKDLADDFCQLGYLKVFNKLHLFRGEGSLEGWVRRVVVTTIINELRGSTKDIQTVSDFDFEKSDVAAEPEKNFDDLEFMGKYSEQDIKDAIKSLPDGYKFVFVKYFFDDLSHKEIAKMLGIGEVGSRTQLSKAKKKIKAYLERLNR